MAGKVLTDKQITILPVRISGQANPLINSVSGCYPPPRTHDPTTMGAPPQHLARNYMAPAPTRYEPFSVFLLLPEQSRLRTCPWNIRRRVEHCGAHQGRFHSPHRFSEARVRRKGPSAHGTGAMAGVVTGDRSRDRRRELAGTTTQEDASGDRQEGDDDAGQGLLSQKRGCVKIGAASF